MISALRSACLLLIILVHPICVHAQLLTWFNFNWHTGNSRSTVVKVTGDNSGNTFYLIQFSGTITVDSDTVTSSSNEDFLIVKRNSSNVLQWHRQLTSAGWFGCRGLTADSSGNVYVVGYTLGAFPVYLDSTPTTTATIPLQVEKSAFFAKYNSTGTMQWVKVLEGQSSSQWPVGIDLDLIQVNGQSLFMSGLIEGYYDFDPGAGVTVVGANGGTSWTIISTFDLDGNLKWASFLGSYARYIANVIFTPEQGVIIASDLVTGTDINSGPVTDWRYPVGPSDIFMTMLDSSGTHQWSEVVHGNQTQEIKGITWLSDTTFTICGNTNAAFDLDPGPGNCPISWNSGLDPFIGIFNIDGTCDTGTLLYAGISPYALHYSGSEYVMVGYSSPGSFIMTGLDTNFNFTYYTITGSALSVRGLYFQYPNALFVTGSATGNNGYGFDGNTNIYVTTDSSTGFSCKYFLGWGPMSLNEPDPTEMFSVFPNPASGEFTVDIGAIPRQDGQLTIYQTTGNVVWAQKVAAGSDPFYAIDARSWPTGVYFINYQDSFHSATQKLVKTE